MNISLRTLGKDWADTGGSESPHEGLPPSLVSLQVIFLRAEAFLSRCCLATRPLDLLLGI